MVTDVYFSTDDVIGYYYINGLNVINGDLLSLNPLASVINSAFHCKHGYQVDLTDWASLNHRHQATIFLLNKLFIVIQFTEKHLLFIQL